MNTFFIRLVQQSTSPGQDSKIINVCEPFKAACYILYAVDLSAVHQDGQNLGDTWRALAEQPPLPEHTDRAVIETTFGLNLTIDKHFNNREDFSASLDVPSHRTASRIVQSTTSSPRHFRIFPDYGTEFICSTTMILLITAKAVSLNSKMNLPASRRRLLTTMMPG